MISPGNPHQVRSLLGRQRDRLARLLEREEELHRCLIKGEHAGVAEVNQARASLAEELALWEKRRVALIPAGSTFRTFIAENMAELLPLLEESRALLLRLQTVKELNAVLLQERLRFAQEIKGILLSGEETYNPRGALTPPLEDISRINENR